MIWVDELNVNELNRVACELKTSWTRAKICLFRTWVEFRAELILIKSSLEEFESTRIIPALIRRVIISIGSGI